MDIYSAVYDSFFMFNQIMISFFNLVGCSNITYELPRDRLTTICSHSKPNPVPFINNPQTLIGRLMLTRVVPGPTQMLIQKQVLISQIMVWEIVNLLHTCHGITTLVGQIFNGSQDIRPPVILVQVELCPGI